MQIFNSYTGRKEEFRPLTPGVVRMYVCGDTVYDFCHIGHARSKIAFDVVRRYLNYRGYKVTFVRNITDIDDRIIERAHKDKDKWKDWKELTQTFTKYMHEDYDRLGVMRPDHEPKATEHVPGIIAMTQMLIEKGYAYVAKNGDVLYSVARFAAYGRLSGKDLSELRAGARVAIDEAKHDPADFVLWKQAKPGEPKWPSPWGEGRPGWHIECSAMSLDILGPRFDIHGGGMDLKFPHHENEIAQSCAATGDTFAQIWMHNGFVNVDNEKMSKSLGNFFRIRDVIGEPGATAPQLVRHPEVLRYFLLSSHYRGPINYSLVQIEQADAGLGRLYTALTDVQPAEQISRSNFSERFEAAMDDDFNTPEAVAALQLLATDLNKAKSDGNSAQAGALARELLTLGDVLGVGRLKPKEFWKMQRSESVGGPASADVLTPADIEQLIEQRRAARKAKNFREGDRIREELKAAGIELEDKPDGSTSWRRA